jgi:N-methylhydantoinase A
VIPRTAPAFSALGLLVADYVVDLSRAYVTPLGEADPLRIGRICEELAAEASKELEPAGLPAERVRTQRYAGLCYPGQNFDMMVPIPDGPVELDALAAAFHDLHEKDRGFAFRSVTPDLRQVRVVTTGVTDKPESAGDVGASSADAARRGSRPAYFDDGFVDTAVYDGPALAPGSRITGPALVEEPFTVIVVAPGQSLELDPAGTFHLRA